MPSSFASSDLEGLVSKFNDELTESLLKFSGDTYRFFSTALGDEIVSIRLAQTDEGEPGIVALRSQGEVLVGIKPEFKCSWDSTKSFLAIETSSFAVFPYAKTTTAPLFRVEYERSKRNFPSSHFHVHAHRDEFTHLLSFAHKLNAEKERKVKQFLNRTPVISSFHFPTGGHRFRPCLEDVLEALRIEFRLDVEINEWSEHLQETRLKWRKTQAAAVVRDSPEVALKVLTEEFGLPLPNDWTRPSDNNEKILRD